MTTQTITTGVDSWAQENHPAKTHGSQTTLKTRADDGTGNTSYIYIWLRCPAIKGDTVSTATLRLTARTAAATSQTFTTRRISGSWKQSSLDWNTQPSVPTSSSVTTVVSSIASGDVVELDVTAMYQTAANGGAFYGVRIETTRTDDFQIFYSLNSEFPPSLEIDYFKKPEAPTALVPAGVVGAAAPVVTCDYTDTTGNSFISAIQVQADPAADETSPAFDSGMVASETPTLDLSTTTFTPLASGASTQWRVRVEGDAGDSPWSDWKTITYQPRGTVTITNPSAGAVGSPTFEADATFSGTVEAWRVKITSGSDRTDIRYDSGKRTSSTISVEIPSKYKGQRIVHDDGTYQISFHVWDDVDGRVASPGCAVPAVAWATFTMVDDSSTAPDSVTATTFNDTPIVTVQWHRTTEPDSWVIRRDGKVIATPDMSEVTAIGGGVYQWADTTASPLTAHNWAVKAVTTGAQSAAGFSGSTTLTPGGGVWLLTEDGTAYVCIRDAIVEGATNMDQAASYQTIGSRGAFRVVTALSGRSYTGFKGRLKEGVGGRTMAQWRDDALTIKAQPTENVRLVQADENLLVQVSSMSITADSSSTPARPVAAIQFDYRQVGEYEYGGRV